MNNRAEMPDGAGAGSIRDFWRGGAQPPEGASEMGGRAQRGRCYTSTNDKGAVPQEGADLQYYTPETWFTAEGARLKARRLERSGLPDMTNWRFMTLTVATRGIAPDEAYKRGKDRLRRFLGRFRKAVGRSFKWCWKLEFHEDGYAHWHLVIEYTKQIPEDMLTALEKWWGLGRVNVKRVKQRELYYVFKYVSKGMEDLPPWVENYRGRLRVFQSSKGFFVRPRRASKEKQEPRYSMVPLTLGVRMQWDARKALMVEMTPKGEKRVSIVKLRMPFSELYLARVYQAVAKQVQLVGFGAVPISTSQALEIKYEHKRYSGLGRIPRNAAAA